MKIRDPTSEEANNSKKTHRTRQSGSRAGGGTYGRKKKGGKGIAHEPADGTGNDEGKAAEYRYGGKKRRNSEVFILYLPAIAV